MHSVMRVTVAATVLGIASLSLAASAHAGNGSAVGAGLLGFGVGAIVGNALAPQTVYVAPPPPVYYAPPPLFTSRPYPRSTLGRCTTGIRTIEDIAANVGLRVRVEPCADDSRVDGCSMEKPRTGDDGRGFSVPDGGTTDGRERRHHRLGMVVLMQGNPLGRWAA